MFSCVRNGKYAVFPAQKIGFVGNSLRIDQIVGQAMRKSPKAPL